MEAKPLPIVPSPQSNSGVGGGPQMKVEGDEVDEGKRGVLVKGENSSSSVELDLGAGADSAENPVIHQKCYQFTDFQRRELHHQFFIFNHFASNLQRRELGHMSGFDYGTMEDPEPRRCRRTDGKKWRCSRNIVPHEKYCERHVHRGRNRSRKPVETSQVNSSCLTTKPSGNSSHAKPAPKTEPAVSSPNIVTIHDMPSTQLKSFRVANTSSANSASRNVTGSADYKTPFSPAIVMSPPSAAVAPKVTTVSSMASGAPHNTSRLNVHNKDQQNRSCINNKISIKSSGKGSTVSESNGISTGIGFSPRSVLQVPGCNRPSLNDGNIVESEPGRCRRTDGKKWRCKRGVLPGEKYCGTHVNRGSNRKRSRNHEPAATTTHTSSGNAAPSPHPSATTNIQKANCRIPNTNLSMSVPASAAASTQCDDEKSHSSSSDTEITISDTMNECSSYLCF